MFKKIICLLLSIFLIVPICSNTNFIFAEDEEENEEEIEEVEDNRSDREKCIEDQDEDACNAIIASAKNIKNRINEIDSKISSAQSNKEEALALAKEYAQKAAIYQSDIDDLKVQIEELEKRIEILIGQIAENEAKVEALNARVKDRMVSYQMTMHFNGYLEFLLGSDSFTDMLRRLYGINAITSKDKTDREDYIDTLNQLNLDKKELDEAKKTLDESYDELVTKQLELKKMEEFYEQKAQEIQDDLDQMTAEKDEIYDSFSDLNEILKAAGYTVNDGFVAAVHNSTIVEGVWHYSDDFLGGTWHLGVDYAAGYGTELHAPAGGMIIRADDGCGYGYLGNRCGAWIAGGGNQVYLMCEVDGVVYGFMFFHLSEVYVEYGDLVLQDEVIGRVGSSGSSTGPHCHLEMYKLGYGTLAEYLEMNWNATFSCGRGAVAYGNRCSINSAPCILDPEDYLPG